MLRAVLTGHGTEFITSLSIASPIPPSRPSASTSLRCQETSAERERAAWLPRAQGRAGQTRARGRGRAPASGAVSRACRQTTWWASLLPKAERETKAVRPLVQHLRSPVSSNKAALESESLARAAIDADPSRRVPGPPQARLVPRPPGRALFSSSRSHARVALNPRRSLYLASSVSTTSTLPFFARRTSLWHASRLPTRACRRRRSLCVRPG